MSFFKRLYQNFAFAVSQIRWFYGEAANHRVKMIPGSERLPVFLQTVRFVIWKARNQAIWWRAIPGGSELNRITPEMEERFLTGFDDASIAAIRDTAFFIYRDSLNADRTIIMHKRGDIPAKRSEFEKALPNLKARFTLPPGIPFTPEVFLYRHGLALVPGFVLEYLKGKVFLDAGAFIGDSLLALLDYAPSLVISFDMSKNNRELFLQTMKANGVPDDKYLLVSKGLGESSGKISFDDTGRSNTTFYMSGADETDVISVDDYCIPRPDRKIGFIKADIEGFGLKMARGMLETVRRDRPVLSLAVYHCPDEFFGIKLLLEKEKIDYVFRFFHLHYTRDCEMVLFGWPREIEKNV